MEQNGNRPELFEDIVRAAILLLERLAAKRENLDYEVACTEYEKTYGDKVTDTMSIRDRLRQNERIVKEREAARDYRARQKDKRAR